MPTYNDAAISTYMVTSKPKSEKMVSTINSYTKVLIDIWKRSFGDLHFTSKSSVTNKLQKLRESYYSHLYLKVNRKSEKHKKNAKSVGKSSRQLSRSLRTMLLP